MSKIDTLIAELCPDGVEYRKVGEIANIRKGEQLNKNSLLADGLYPVLNGGRDYSGYWTEFNSKSGVVTVSQGGASAGFVSWMTVPFWAGAHCYVVEKSASCEARYLFHVMKSCEAGFMQSQYGAGIPSLSAKTLAGTEIPVPPIEVQREIVRILDSFAALTEELTAKLSEEVAARKAQYAYYRGRLLSRESLEAMDGMPVEMKELSAIGELFGGHSFKSTEYVSAGARVIRISDVQAGTLSSETPKYCPVNQPERAQKAKLQKDDLVISLTGNVGRVAVIDIDVLPAYLNQRVEALRVDSGRVMQRFIFQYLNRVDFVCECEQASSGSAQKNLSSKWLERYEIPVPSLETQRKVVGILDRLDALTASLTDGITVEIEARKMQYAHYRDRLLDFPRKAIETE